MLPKLRPKAAKAAAGSVAKAAASRLFQPARFRALQTASPICQASGAAFNPVV
jgi:hypothetical protein